MSGVPPPPNPPGPYGPSQQRYGPPPSQPPYGQAPSQPPYGQAPSQPPYGQARGGPVPPGRPPRPRRTGRTIAIVVVAGVVVVAIAATIGALAWTRSAANAALGDCLSYRDGPAGLRRGDCADPGVEYRLLGLTDGIRACGDVAGTTLAVEGDRRTYCLGPKDADPATAVNTAEVGDCLRVQGDDATLAGCARGTRPVLAVLRNQLKASNSGDSLSLLCLQTEGTDAAYGWSIETQGSVLGTWDRVFCLGPER